MAMKRRNKPTAGKDDCSASVFCIKCFFVILLGLINGSPVCGETTSPATEIEQDTFSIVMIPWRGRTDAEKG